MNSTPHIRWLIRRDMPEVMAIEMDVFEFPWESGDDKEPPPKGSFIHVLRQRNCIGMVVELDGKVAGYMVYSLERTRIDVMNFAVRRDLWRTGIGRAMMEKLVGKMSSQRRSRLIFEVRETNLAMQLFLRSMGLRAVSVIEGGNWDHPCQEDAYRFVYRYAPQPSRRTARVEADCE